MVTVLTWYMRDNVRFCIITFSVSKKRVSFDRFNPYEMVTAYDNIRFRSTTLRRGLVLIFSSDLTLLWYGDCIYLVYAQVFVS